MDKKVSMYRILQCEDNNEICVLTTVDEKLATQLKEYLENKYDNKSIFKIEEKVIIDNFDEWIKGE